MGRFFNVDPLSEKYAYQSHYNFSENRVVDGRELEGLEWSKSTDGKSMHIHGVIRNQSSYNGDLKPIAETIKSANEKAYSVGGVKTTFSYEFNQDADPSKQYVFTLSNPLETKVTLKTDEKGNILGYEKVTKAGEAFMDSPTVNDVSVVVTKGKNSMELENLATIGQRSVHENGHGAGLDHSWEKNSGVNMDKVSQEANAMNSGQKESAFPVSDASNKTITPKQIQNILNNPKIPQR
ncbi:hypothetical protein IW15_21470 [Chryseobacterium soli]|uniref:RHS repeat-associated core domain-containing protein n=2 Tax=Chryseobacterium soli TaxID=445961 RepID=A0A086A096_9FLAO|nr:hypothetical protein IW15_21470 [Chryseobacterium soli]